MMDLMQAGLRIKRLRKQHKLTQEKLAELVNLSPHYIFEIEKGVKAMSIYTLHDIVAALDTSADYIYMVLHHQQTVSVPTIWNY